MGAAWPTAAVVLEGVPDHEEEAVAHDLRPDMAQVVKRRCLRGSGCPGNAGHGDQQLSGGRGIEIATHTHYTIRTVLDYTIP